MALWRPTPTFLYHERRVIGATVGRYFDDRVAFTRFRHGTPWSEKQKALEGLLRLNWNDANNMIADLSNASPQFGRTYFGKQPSTAPTANNWYDWWALAGQPQAGAINGTAYTAVQFSESSVGAMGNRGNVSTYTKNLLSMWAYPSANTPMLMLYDRVLAYDQCSFNANSNQALTNGVTAQRYASGAPGLLICFVANAVQGATASNLTKVSYTNQAGSLLQQMPTTVTVVFIPSVAAASSTLGARVCAPSTSGQTVPWTFSIPLASGDTGASLVHDFTTSAANSGSFSIVLMHPLTDMMLPAASVPIEKDTVYQTSELERMYDGCCPALMAYLPAATAIVTVQGGIRYGWGLH